MRLTRMQALAICNWVTTLLINNESTQDKGKERESSLSEQTNSSINIKDYFKLELYRSLLDAEFASNITLAIRVDRCGFEGEKRLAKLFAQTSEVCGINIDTYPLGMQLKVKISGEIKGKSHEDDVAWTVISPALISGNESAVGKSPVADDIDPMSSSTHSMAEFNKAADREGKSDPMKMFRKLRKKIKKYETEFSEFHDKAKVSKSLEMLDSKSLYLELDMCLQIAEKIVDHAKESRHTREHVKNLEDFISTICHEIRNPLSGIYGAVEALGDKIDDLDNIFKECLDKLDQHTIFKVQELLIKLKKTAIAIKKCANHQKMIVDDVLDLARVENSKMELDFTPFCIQDMLKDIIKMYSLQTQQKNLNVKSNIPADKLWVKSDPSKLRQIITNLISNAIKFTNAGGEIYIGMEATHLSQEETKIYIVVRDTGIGLDEDEAARIFDKFSQANHRISTKYGGSGLGLALCKNLVKMMSGEIWVKSQKYRGSEFGFFVKCLPLSEKEILSARQYSKSSDTSSKVSRNDKRTFLIVEDNTMNQKILARYLKKEGYFYQIANNGLEAIEKFKRFKFDLIFMDIEMPIMGGFEATQKIRQIEKDERTVKTFIIGLSGNAFTEHVQKAMSVGMDGYLTKPYRKEEIYQTIQEKLGSTSLVAFNVPNRGFNDECDKLSASTNSSSLVFRSELPSSSTSSHSFFTATRPLAIDNKTEQSDSDLPPIIRSEN